MNDSVERLTAGLNDAQHEDLGDLSELAARLAEDAVPGEPGPEDNARLLAALDPYLPKAARPEAAPHRSLRSWLGLAWSQARLLQPAFWWSGALILAVGIIVAVLEGDGVPALLFVFMTPVLSAAGVAYAFRPETRTLWELERLTPTGPLELLYVRLGLILVFDALVSLLLLGTVWLQVPQVIIWRLLLAWLGPMTALAGVALYTTLRWGPTLGAVLSLGLWGTFVLVGWWQAVSHAADAEPVAGWLLAQINGAAVIPVASLLAAAMGLLLLWQSGRLVGENTWA